MVWERRNMGYADREYFRDGERSSSGRLTRAPVVKWLLILNLGVFVLEFFGLRSAFEALGFFSVEKAILNFQIWRFITFQFLHADFGHLLFNSIAIYFFGSFVEQQLRSRAFLTFYLLCGGAGALGYSALVSANPAYPDDGVVGASGGIFGILAIAALIAPDMRVRLFFPPVTLTMRLLAIIMLGYGALVIIYGGRNAGGEAGHLGGALAGFLMWKIPAFRQFLHNLARPRGAPARKRGGFGIRITKEKKSYTRKLGPKIKNKEEEADVDRILDKINEHGLQSLTEEERKLLSDSGNRKP